MKKYLLFLLFHVCAIQMLIAADLTPDQTKLRNEIQAFLDEKGFMPKVINEKFICFKKKDTIYQIFIPSEDKNPMCVSLSMFCPYDFYSKEFVLQASQELYEDRAVKLICHETEYQIRTGTYLVSFEAFESIFYKLMDQIDSVEWYLLTGFISKE